MPFSLHSLCPFPACFDLPEGACLVVCLDDELDHRTFSDGGQQPRGGGSKIGGVHPVDRGGVNLTRLQNQIMWWTKAMNMWSFGKSKLLPAHMRVVSTSKKDTVFLNKKLKMVTLCATIFKKDNDRLMIISLALVVIIL